jgi:hypothetical protein
MRRFLHELRTLVLGETWTLPTGVAASLLALLAVRELVLPAGRWADVAGLLTLACALAVLWACVRPR